MTSAHPEKVQELSSTWLRWNAQLRPPLWAPQQGYRETSRSCLDRSIARPQEAYAGTWRGTFGTITEFVWNQRADGTGTITLGPYSGVPTRVVHVSADSLVVDVTEPVSTGRQGAVMVTLRLLSFVCGDQLSGFVLSTRPNRTISRTPITARRSP